MKYVFGLAFFVLAYAMVGVVTHRQQTPNRPIRSATVAATPTTLPQAPGGLAVEAPRVRTDTPEVLLVKAIQRTLADAQCYDGAIDGEWTDSTRQAMERVVAAARSNAPVLEPSPQLLQLLRATVGLQSACAPLQNAVVSSPAAVASEGAVVASPADAVRKFDAPQSPNRARPAESAFRHPLGTL